MTRGQLALMRALFLSGVLVLATGVVLLIVDVNTAEPECKTNMSGYQICGSTDPSMRGGWIGAVGFLIVVVTMVAWSTLPKLDEGSKAAADQA